MPTIKEVVYLIFVFIEYYDVQSGIYLYMHILEEILMHKKHTLWLFNLLILILDTSETTSVFLPWPWSRLAGDEGEPLWYPWGSAKCPVW